MINEAQGKYLVYNGEIERQEETTRFDDIKKAPQYEVLTVVDGVALFFEEHMERLENTAKMLNIKLSRSRKQIEEDVYTLISTNEIERAFVKLIVSDDDYLVYEFYDKYPTAEEFLKGVMVSIFDYERENPNAKILHSEFKREVAAFMVQTGSFEALLRSENGELLEGSRTNLYFTSNDKVITAPSDRVLKGITRRRLEKVFKNKNIEVEEKVISDVDLVNIDGAFLTGTTVGVVPIKAIESIELKVDDNKVIREVMEGYLELERDYINKRRQGNK